VSIDGANTFAVDGVKSLENYIQAFYDDKAAEETQKAFIRITGLKIEYITRQTQEELALLKEDAQARQASYEAGMDLPNIQHKLDKNINFYEVEIKEAKDKGRFFYAPTREYTREDKALRKLHVSQLEERLDRLQKMQKEAKKIEAGKYAYNDVNEWDSNQTLQRFNQEIEEIAKD